MKKLTIWKFPLEIHGLQDINMPLGAKLLHVETQDNVPTLWAMVDPTQAKASRRIEIRGTGAPFYEANRIYISTYQNKEGCIYHAFEFLDD